MINLVDMINLESLPFFGRTNTISRIQVVDTEDNEKCLLVKRYDVDGNEKPENFFVPINLKNVIGIIENFCKDSKDYLAKNENKYIEYRKKKKTFNFDVSLNKLNSFDKLSKIGICLGTVLLGLTFSVISIPIVFYTGMIIVVVGGIGMVVVSDINKELEQSQFVSDYDMRSRKLNEYRSYLDNKHNKLTEYNGLSNTKDKNRENSLELKKIRRKS